MSGRPPRTTPRDHGRVKYSREGCRCQVCRHDHNTHQARLAYLRATGRPTYVDATPVRDHVTTLLVAGMTYPQIGALAGVERTVVRVLHRGHAGKPPSRRVRTETAKAVMAVQPDPTAVVPQARLEGHGTRRRIEALLADGWPQQQLARLLGAASCNGVQKARSGRVTAATYVAVRDLYEQLCDEAAPRPAFGRMYRERYGYAPSICWVGIDIDDPWAVPADPPAEQPARDALNEDIDWLLEQGETSETIAVRLAVSVELVDQRASHLSAGGRVRGGEVAALPLEVA